jgi:hypothetical protein
MAEDPKNSLKTQQGITAEIKKQKELLASQTINSKEYESTLKRVNQLEQKKANLLKTQKGISDSEREAQAKTKTIQSQIQSSIDARLKKVKELKTLESASNTLAKEAQNNQANLLEFIKTRVNKSGELSETSKEQLAVVESMNMGQNDISGLQKQLDLSKAREKSLFGSNAKFKEDEKLLQGVIGDELKRAQAQKLTADRMALADKATGGMASKAKEVGSNLMDSGKRMQTLKMGALGLGGILVGVIIKAVTGFSKKIDQIGESFGFMTNKNKEFRNDLIDSGNEAMMIGKNLSDVLAVTSQLSSEFGITLKESQNIAGSVLDTAVATGISNDEATKLFGTFMQIGNLTSKQAEDLIEGTAQLAAQRGVAPTAVLRDMAGSAEEIASFTKDGGNNIAEAAVQARQMGLSLSTTAKIAEGLLDFESSIANEVTASVMIGKQLNFQKARQLALEGDIAGATKNIVSQVGSEAEFNKLNVLQRKSLAKSIGVSVVEMNKLVKGSKELTLSGAMAGKKFDDLVGQDSLSALTSIINAVKAIGASLLDEIGKPLAEMLQQFIGPDGLSNIKKQLVEIANIAIEIFNTGRSIANTFRFDKELENKFRLDESGNFVRDVKVNDFSSGPGGITTMMGPAGVFSLNPRDSVLATTNPIPVNDISMGPAGSKSVGGTQKIEVTGTLIGTRSSLMAVIEQPLG